MANTPRVPPVGVVGRTHRAASTTADAVKPSVSASPPATSIDKVAGPRESRAVAFARRSTADVGTATLAPLRLGGTGSLVEVKRPDDLIRRIQDGTLTIRVPMVAGVDMGKVKVRPDTFAITTLAVKNGRLDLERTGIRFVRSDGSETDLDGPLWWDAENIYIASDGTFRADVPCYPDPDVTEEVLGKGNTKIPDNPLELMELLQAANQPPATGEPARDALQLAVDVQHASYVLDATLMPGPLRFGEGSVINIAEGTELHGVGEPATMALHLEAEVRSAQLTAGDSRLRTGPGHLSLDIDLINDAQANDLYAPPKSAHLTVRGLDVQRLEIEAPTADGMHRLSIGHVAVRGDATGDPIIDWQAAQPGDDGAGVPASLRLAIPEIDLRGVSAALQIHGTDGRPATLTIGEGAAVEDPAPLNIRGRVELDSTTAHFLFDAEVENFAASMGPVALIDSDNFDLILSDAQLRGSGRVRVESQGERGSLRLDSAPGQRWELRVGVADAKIGVDAEVSQFIVDVAAESRGILHIDSLDLQSGAPPVFRGDAELEVRLDALDVPLPGGQHLRLAAGSVGTLSIPAMGWASGDASPTVEATLRVQLAPEVVFRPGAIPGLEGAEIVVDAKTGHHALELRATLAADGTIQTAAGIRVRGAEVTTRVSHGMAAPDAPQIPAASLEAVERFRLARVRHLATRADSTVSVVPPALPTDGQRPALPEVRVSPVEIWNTLEDPALNFSIPTDALNIPLLDIDAYHDGWIDDVGFVVKTTIERAAGEIAANFEVIDGQIQPGVSRIELRPPLDVPTFFKVWHLGPWTDETTVHMRIAGLQVRRDPETGRGYLWPDLRWEGEIPDALRELGTSRLEEEVRVAVGELLSLALVGEAQFSLDAKSFRRQLSRRVPQLSEDLVFQPEIPGVTQPGGLVRGLELPEIELPAGIAELAETFLSTIHPERIEFAAHTSIYTPDRFDLGNGQFITFARGTELTVTGTQDDFTITGRALVDGLRLGGDAIGVSLDSGEATFEVHIVAGAPGEPPRLDAQLRDLEARGLSLRGAAGSVRGEISGASVRGATISFTRGGAEGTQFIVDLPEVEASFSVSGFVQAGDQTGHIGSLQGHVRGSVRLTNGDCAADLSEISLEARGLSSSAAPGAEVDRLSIQGGARLRLDASGFSLERSAVSGERLRLSTSLELPDGSRLSVRDGGADLIRLTPGETPTLIAEGLSASVSLLMPVVVGDGNSGSVLDLRNVTFNGGLSFGPQGLQTLGPVQIRDLDASVTQLILPLSDQARLDLEQVDIVGNGQLEITADGTVTFMAPEEGGLTARAIARDIRFAVAEPELSLDLAPDAQVRLNVRELRLGRDGRIHAALYDGSFDGVIESGHMTVGSDAALVNRLDMPAGTRVHADLHALAVTADADGKPQEVELDVSLRVEGVFELGVEALSAVDLPDGVTLDRLDARGSFRMAMRAMASGPRTFAATARTLIDADVDGAATIDVARHDPPVRLPR